MPWAIHDLPSYGCARPTFMLHVAQCEMCALGLGFAEHMSIHMSPYMPICMFIHQSTQMPKCMSIHMCALGLGFAEHTGRLDCGTLPKTR